MKSSRPVFRNILVPVDGSAPSRRGVQAAVRLARQLEARVTAVHIITPFEAYAYSGDRRKAMTPAAFEANAGKAAARVLDRARRACAAQRVPCSVRTAWDTGAAEAIVRLAKLHRCDLIVMATHGRSTMRRMLMGSVARAVLARSKVPVVVCP